MRQESGASPGRAAREGLFDVVTDIVERVGGRQPTAVADFVTARRSVLVAASHRADCVITGVRIVSAATAWQ